MILCISLLPQLIFHSDFLPIFYGINVRRRIFIGYKILSNGTCSSLQMIFERRFCREIDLPCGQFRNVSKKTYFGGQCSCKRYGHLWTQKEQFCFLPYCKMFINRSSSHVKRSDFYCALHCDGNIICWSLFELLYMFLILSKRKSFCN